MIYPHKELRVINALEERLNANKHKGDTWMSVNHMYLRNKITEEYAEVMLDPSNPKELADLANVTIMLLWRYAR